MRGPWSTEGWCTKNKQNHAYVTCTSKYWTVPCRQRSWRQLSWNIWLSEHDIFCDSQTICLTTRYSVMTCWVRSLTPQRGRESGLTDYTDSRQWAMLEFRSFGEKLTSYRLESTRNESLDFTWHTRQILLGNLSRIGTIGGLLWKRNEHSGSIQWGEFLD
jgi:hypothetical protein